MIIHNKGTEFESFIEQCDSELMIVATGGKWKDYDNKFDAKYPSTIEGKNMCNLPTDDPDGIHPPENVLSGIIARDLAVIVDPRLLRLFVQLHWDKITKYAHKIHEQLKPRSGGDFLEVEKKHYQVNFIDGGNCEILQMDVLAIDLPQALQIASREVPKDAAEVKVHWINPDQQSQL